MIKKCFFVSIVLLSLVLNGQIVREPHGISYKFYDGDQQIMISEVSGKVVEKYPDGNIKGEYNYKNGKMDGMQKEFFEDGKLAAEYNMTMGVRNGVGKEYYTDSSLRYERDLDNGNGLGTEYYHNGMKMREYYYENDELIHASRYNQDIFGKPYERDAEGLYIESQYFSSIGMYYHAIAGYEEFLAKYPTNEKAPNVAFLIGFTYNNHIRDLKKAEKSYKDFIAKYPDNELVVSAEFELKTLGKSENELPEFGKEDKE